jgi:hypothetical protein
VTSFSLPWYAIIGAKAGTDAKQPILACLVGFVLRLLALYRGWEEPLESEPGGAYLHSDGRPLLGRKLSGKSQREARDLGLTVEPDGATGSQ